MSCNSCNESAYSSNIVVYKGAPLACIEAEKCESSTVVLQKAEQVLCELQTAINILQQQVNALVATTTTLYPTTTTTTTAPGLIFVENNSVDVTVNDLWVLEFIPGGTSLYYYAIPYSGNTFPLAPGQSGYFTFPGSNPSAIYHQIDYSANSGGATATGSCPGTGNAANLASFGGITAVLIGCGGVPINPGEVRSIVINQ